MNFARCLILLVCGLGACGVNNAGLGGGGAGGTGGVGTKGTGGGASATGGNTGGKKADGTGGRASGGAPGSGGSAGQAGGVAGRGPGGAGAATPEPCAGGMTYTYIVRSLATMGPVIITGGGTTRDIFGFDLDGRDSDGTQAEDCGVADAVSLDGRRGIDNTVAGLWSEDLAPAFQPGLMDGNVTSTIRLSGVDSFTDDSCVDVTWSTEFPQFRRAKIEGGRLIADGSSPIPLQGKAIPLNASSPVAIVLPLSSPRISFRPAADALRGGMVGGSVTVDELVTLYRTVFGALADGLALGLLHPDLPAEGRPCTLLSAGFAFEATTGSAPAN